MDSPDPSVRRSSGRVTAESANIWEELASKDFLPPIPPGHVRKRIDVTESVVDGRSGVDWVASDVRQEFSY